MLYVCTQSCCLSMCNLWTVSFYFFLFILILSWNSHASNEGALVAKFYAEFCLLVGCRIYNDVRFCMMFQLTLPLAIPVIAVLYRSKYTHSRYWFFSTGKPWILYFFYFPGRSFYVTACSCFWCEKLFVKWIRVYCVSASLRESA